MVSEVLKYGGDFIRTLIHEVCVNVYNNYNPPKQWTTNFKGNPQLMTNYQGITLMSIATKVNNKVLLNPIIPIVDQVFRQNKLVSWLKVEVVFNKSTSSEELWKEQQLDNFRFL